MLAIRGAPTRAAALWTCSGVCRASTKITSAPASRQAAARWQASSKPVTATASVRAISTVSGSLRAWTAARIFAVISSLEISCLPSMWPQCLGPGPPAGCPPHRRPRIPTRSGPRSAIAVVRVCDDGDGGAGAGASEGGGHLLKGDEADVQPAQDAGGHTAARHVHRGEARRLNRPGGPGIIGPRGHNNPVPGQQGPELRGSGHR